MQRLENALAESLNASLKRETLQGAHARRPLVIDGMAVVDTAHRAHGTSVAAGCPRPVGRRESMAIPSFFVTGAAGGAALISRADQAPEQSEPLVRCGGLDACRPNRHGRRRPAVVQPVMLAYGQDLVAPVQGQAAG